MSSRLPVVVTRSRRNRRRRAQAEIRLEAQIDDTGVQRMVRESSEKFVKRMLATQKRRA